MRVIFMGTPDFAVPTLEALVAAGHEVIAVYSQPPRPAGRGQAERKSPVHLAAEALGIEVCCPKNFKDQSDVDAFKALGADICVVVAYGLLLPKSILDAPALGCLNLHGSLLPRWRGAAPLQRAILSGDTVTGVMVMRMDEGLDTGPVALTHEIGIGSNMVAGELHDEMRAAGAALMVTALDRLATETLEFAAQPETGATYAKKIGKAELRVDFSRPAPDVHNQIRAFSPAPGAFGVLDGLGRVKLLRSIVALGDGPAGEVLDAGLTIACGVGAIRVLEAQREGGRPMATAEFLRGAGTLKGRRFS